VRVLGVDPSLTITGCALVTWGGGVEPLWETWRARAVKPDVDTVATRRMRVRQMLTEILALVPMRFDLAVVEGPAMGAKFTPLADERAGLRWMLIDQLLARGEVVLVPPATREVLAVGHGFPRGTKQKERKQAVLDGVALLAPGAHVPDHNVGDAVALAAAGARALGMGMPYTAKQEAAHARVAWPDHIAAAA